MGIYKFDFEKLTSGEILNEEIIKYLHHVLFEVSIIEGLLICNNCGKNYEVRDGVPNMVLDDNEV